MSGLKPMVILLLSFACVLSLCPGRASAVGGDFLPLAPGNRWIYVKEIVNGSYVGDYSIDTCEVEVTEEMVAPGPDGTEFSAALVLGLPFSFSGSPCWNRSTDLSDPDALRMYKDAEGNILWRPDDPLAPPDTAAFLEMFPSWTAQRFREYLDYVFQDGLVMMFRFAPAPEMLSEDFWLGQWYAYHLLRTLGTGVGPCSADVSPPFVFEPGAERAMFGMSSIGEVESRMIFEAGIGVTYVSGYNLLGPPTQLNETRLIWARIDGVAYGNRPTGVSASSWAEVKRSGSAGRRPRQAPKRPRSGHQGGDTGCIPSIDSPAGSSSWPAAALPCTD